MLRLHPKADSENIPGMHDPLNAIAAHTLHRVGEELPHTVSLAHTGVAVAFLSGFMLSRGQSVIR